MNRLEVRQHSVIYGIGRAIIGMLAVSILNMMFLWVLLYSLYKAFIQ